MKVSFWFSLVLILIQFNNCLGMGLEQPDFNTWKDSRKVAKDGCCHTYNCYFGCDESQEEDKTRIAVFPFKNSSYCLCFEDLPKKPAKQNSQVGVLQITLAILYVLFVVLINGIFIINSPGQYFLTNIMILLSGYISPY